MTASVGSPEEFVEPCAIGAEWNDTAPRPTLLLMETRLVAIVRLAEYESEPAVVVTEARVTDRAAYALLVFERCQAFTFGGPGDQDLASHRLFPHGLEPSAAHTVPRSSWATSLGAPDLTHFVLTFSSGTLECLARSVSSGRRVATLEEVLAHIGSWLS